MRAYFQDSEGREFRAVSWVQGFPGKVLIYRSVAKWFGIAPVSWRGVCRCRHLLVQFDLVKVDRRRWKRAVRRWDAGHRHA